nr:hypothetical protein [Pseudarthrobacter sp. W1I19]
MTNGPLHCHNVAPLSYEPRDEKMTEIMQGERSYARGFPNLPPTVGSGVAIEVRSPGAEQPFLPTEDARGFDMTGEDLKEFVRGINAPLGTMLRWNDFGACFCIALDLPRDADGAPKEVHISQLQPGGLAQT